MKKNINYWGVSAFRLMKYLEASTRSRFSLQSFCSYPHKKDFHYNRSRTVCLKSSNSKHSIPLWRGQKPCGLLSQQVRRPEGRGRLFHLPTAGGRCFCGLFCFILLPAFKGVEKIIPKNK